ncbi:WXG100 family type VII secretion target [Streptomyces sp. B3I8]|uniref:WXG100 family type VII secretion target n=1 Tax=Streptomyces sp. B3I8 TaxID=3042303 RepID=UPI00278A3F0E|nr:hypothetical protein [Streptomyces sp. B3I8]MDQ0789568.1 hypothetical protein [Streptomyces sp. B3I8]
MGEQPHSREPELSRTDFESMTHEQLAALLGSANTTGAAHLSSKLSKAASTITKIGDDLMTYVKGLEWQGEGGDAFRDWGGQTASSTLRLGQYAEVASRWMGTVSQAIAEAKAAMPDVSETTRAKTDLADAHKTINVAQQPGAHNDPDAQKLAATARTDAAAAQHRIEAARGEAIQQMQKLAQTYEFSAQQVNSLAPPTFSPPARNTGTPTWWDYEKSHVSSGNTYSGRRESDSVYGSAGYGAAEHPSASRHGVSAASGLGVPHMGDRPRHGSEPASLGIDSVDTHGRTLHPSAVPTPTEATPAPRESPSLGQPGPGSSISSFGGIAAGGNTPPRPALGRFAQPFGVAKPAGNMPRAPWEPGIVGGRPVANAGRPTNGIPRGNVIGKDNVQGRTPLGRGMSPGSPVNATARSGSTGGRRLASETGGIVGNRPGQPSRGGSRPFTAGGSGLIRPSSSSPVSTNGRVNPGGRFSNSRSKEQEQRESRRPDYLGEEEETWTRYGHRVLPPVID